MSERPQFKSSYAGHSSKEHPMLKRNGIAPVMKTGKGRQTRTTSEMQRKPRPEHKPRPKRATSRNMRDIAANEARREHAHPLIDRLDTVVLLYCSLLHNVYGDRKVVEQHLYGHVRQASIPKPARGPDDGGIDAEDAPVDDEEFVFTCEHAKDAAKKVYEDISAHVIKIAETGELLLSTRGQIFRRGAMPGCDKRILVVRIEDGRVIDVMCDRRFSRRVADLRTDKRPVMSRLHPSSRPGRRDSKGYINTYTTM